MAEEAPIQVRENGSCLLCFLHVFLKYLLVTFLGEKIWDQTDFCLDLVWLCFHLMRHSGFFNQRLHKMLPSLLYLQLWLNSEAVKATFVSSWDLTRIRDFSPKFTFCSPSTALPLIQCGVGPLWAAAQGLSGAKAPSQPWIQKGHGASLAPKPH